MRLYTEMLRKHQAPILLRLKIPFFCIKTSTKRDHSKAPYCADANRSFSAQFSAIFNANCPVIRPPSIIIGEDISRCLFTLLVAWYFYKNNDP